MYNNILFFILFFFVRELGFVFKYDKLPFRSIDFINGSLRGVDSVLFYFFSLSMCLCVLSVCSCLNEITVVVSSLKYN